MTPTELNQLSKEKQRNALLAIALGGEVAIVQLGNYLVVVVSVDDLMHRVTLDYWQPEEDGALMWRLVCELQEYYGKQASYNSYFMSAFFFACESTQKLIEAYISCDPKGLLEKWRKENE